MYSVHYYFTVNYKEENVFEMLQDPNCYDTPKIQKKRRKTKQFIVYYTINNIKLLTKASQL